MHSIYSVEKALEIVEWHLSSSLRGWASILLDMSLVFLTYNNFSALVLRIDESLFIFTSDVRYLSIANQTCNTIHTHTHTYTVCISSSASDDSYSILASTKKLYTVACTSLDRNRTNIFPKFHVHYLALIFRLTWRFYVFFI